MSLGKAALLLFFHVSGSIMNAYFQYSNLHKCCSLYMLFFIFSVILFCKAAVVFPIGFNMDQIGGEPYQLPNNYQVGISYIFFVLALWITVVSELFASKVCLPHF